MGSILSPLASDSASELNILRHNGNSLSMNSTKIGIFKQTNKISFSCFLKSRNSATLESEICFEILSDFSNQSLERKLPYEKLCALLILSDFTKSNGSWTESVWLLHSSCRRSWFPSGFGGELFPWCFSSGGFSCCLFGTCHFVKRENREKENKSFVNWEREENWDAMEMKEVFGFFIERNEWEIWKFWEDEIGRIVAVDRNGYLRLWVSDEKGIWIAIRGMWK